MKIKYPIVERWKYYTITYIVGCLISMMSTGIRNPYYLIPIKLLGFLFMIILGNALYYQSKGLSRPECTLRVIKYIVLSGLLIGVAYHSYLFLLTNYDIDISPIIAFPEV